MPRQTLSPEEREARRKERVRHSFSDAAYKHYDPKEAGFGSADEWIRVADELAGRIPPAARPRPGKAPSPDLAALFLEAMPSTVEDLKRAFRNAMFATHPDHGGTNDGARAVLEAYKRLLRVFAH